MASNSIAFILRKRERQPIEQNGWKKEFSQKLWGPGYTHYHNNPGEYSSYTERDELPHSKTCPKHSDK